MNINQELQEEATLVNQGQQVEQQVEQQFEQQIEQQVKPVIEQAVEPVIEQAPVVEARTCPTCGRLGFRGARGLAVHRTKDRRCQELRQEIQAVAEDVSQLEDDDSQQEFFMDNDVLLDPILVAENQQILPIYIILLVDLRDAIQ